LRELNEAAYREFPDIQTHAEESTAWPMVSRPTYLGGLGFGLKWNMGWMHDTLDYFSRDPVFRKFHQNQLTFSIWYAFTENFLLPLSHDEVVHGKGSLAGKMPGDDWQKLANLRLLLGFLFAHPGKKLLFMGAELGQWAEWNHDGQLDWDLLGFPAHQGVQRLVRDLNHVYRSEPALHARDLDPRGFEWVDFHDAEGSVISFLRLGQEGDPPLLAVLNFTPVARLGYVVGAPCAGWWSEALNSDADCYGGSGAGNGGGAEARPEPAQGRPASLRLTLPPLSILLFKAPHAI
jgi:1,4-alpha-glucan branching enzyme